MPSHIVYSILWAQCWPAHSLLFGNKWWCCQIFVYVLHPCNNNVAQMKRNMLGMDVVTKCTWIMSGHIYAILLSTILLCVAKLWKFMSGGVRWMPKFDWNYVRELYGILRVYIYIHVLYILISWRFWIINAQVIANIALNTLNMHFGRIHFNTAIGCHRHLHILRVLTHLNFIEVHINNGLKI